jgi:hypothetical protein
VAEKKKEKRKTEGRGIWVNQKVSEVRRKGKMLIPKIFSTGWYRTSSSSKGGLMDLSSSSSPKNPRGNRISCNESPLLGSGRMLNTHILHSSRSAYRCRLFQFSLLHKIISGYGIHKNIKMKRGRKESITDSDPPNTCAIKRGHGKRAASSAISSSQCFP